jgi:hypothetical protein
MSLNLEQGSALTAVFATASAGAALTGLSGGASTYSTSAFGFALNGDAFNRALVSGGATPTTDGNTGAAITLTANQARAIVWTVNAGGTIQVFAGPVVSWTDTSASSTVCQLPSLPGNVAPFAAHTLQAGSTLSGTFTFGSSNWNTAGMSAITVRNLCQLRNQPLLTT